MIKYKHGHFKKVLDLNEFVYMKIYMETLTNYDKVHTEMWMCRRKSMKIQNWNVYE